MTVDRDTRRCQICEKMIKVKERIFGGRSKDRRIFTYSEEGKGYDKNWYCNECFQMIFPYQLVESIIREELKKDG